MVDSASAAPLAWREDWETWASGRDGVVPPPPHPTYDMYAVIDAALAEDAGDLGDITTNYTIGVDARAEATFVAKATGVFAGEWLVQAVLARVDPSLELEWRARDGARVVKGDVLGVARGSARSILVAERVALNFIQRTSGIATAAAAGVAALAEGTQRAHAEGASDAASAGASTSAPGSDPSAGSPSSSLRPFHATVLLDTRKTVPGLRLVDKWAVRAGGAASHRIGLYDMAMLKDNHVDAAGGVRAAVAAISEGLATAGVLRPLEVEARTLDEVRELAELLDGGARISRIMLDNMTPRRPDGSTDTALLERALDIIGHRAVETEASGNVTLETMPAIAATGVQYVSSGALTHSVTALDISLLIKT